MKVDRRINKTKAALKKSLHTLILEKGYDEISIQEITDHADLGRATFYLHYQDKDELFGDILQDITNTYFQTLSPQEIHTNTFLDEKILEGIFNYSKEYASLFNKLNDGRSGVVGFRLLTQIVRKEIAKKLQMSADDDLMTLCKLTLTENYLAGATLTLVFWWLENNMPIPSKSMSQLLAKANLACIEAVENGLEAIQEDLTLPGSLSKFSLGITE
ncbi:MAG: TetR/AcrR family transcriptional regulator [Chloroflexi bacterium]|mgnify:CR=1 FL=1|jgi:AcrR family transcriptional regulator|nr:TetR/AcrR family transcriptional regulator [Chloroflexota bacterium]